jgi:hypothetical protein
MVILQVPILRGRAILAPWQHPWQQVDDDTPRGIFLARFWPSEMGAMDEDTAIPEDPLGRAIASTLFDLVQTTLARGEITTAMDVAQQLRDVLRGSGPNRQGHAAP